MARAAMMPRTTPASLSFPAKKEFMAGNLEKGREIHSQGVHEMNNGVTMKPEDGAALIPRASVFLSSALGTKCLGCHVGSVK